MAHTRVAKKRIAVGSSTFILDRVDRLQLLMMFFGAFCAIIVIRLFMIQVVQHSFYSDVANNQQELVQRLVPERGEVYAQDKFADTGLSVIATNQQLQHVYADTRHITDPTKTTEAIAPILGLDPAMVQERLSKQNDVYEPLKHYVSEREVKELEKVMTEQGLKGVYWIPEESRYYPEGNITSSVTGFVGMVDDQKKGQYGIEGFFDEELAGKEGNISKELDALGRFIAVGDSSITEAQDGKTVVLTIDKNIQYKACTLLEQAVEERSAKQGTVMVMDPKTGAILALCNAPSYDPNNYGDVEDISQYSVDAVSEPYEPGSVMKPIAMAAAIDAGVVSPYTTYTDTGVVQVEKYQIRNSDKKSNGTVDMTTVLVKSLNTGIIFAIQKLGNEKWYDYLQQFGFGAPTGIELSNEKQGSLESVALKKDIYTATSSYGQGMLATPIQMIQAYGAIANGGVMMKPYIVDRVVDFNGDQQITKPQEAGRPISAETASTVSAMLVRVVDNHTIQHPALSKYYIAGKTGTAQVPAENGQGYDAHRHKDTFMGFLTVSDPRAVILVKIDEPADVAWAEGSTKPVFNELAAYLTTYLQIPPDRTE